MNASNTNKQKVINKQIHKDSMKQPKSQTQSGW